MYFTRFIFSCAAPIVPIAQDPSIGPDWFPTSFSGSIHQASPSAVITNPLCWHKYHTNGSIYCWYPEARGSPKRYVGTNVETSRDVVGTEQGTASSEHQPAWLYTQQQGQGRRIGQATNQKTIPAIPKELNECTVPDRHHAVDWNLNFIPWTVDGSNILGMNGDGLTTAAYKNRISPLCYSC